MKENTKKLAYAGLMAALCYVGYAVFPAINAMGTKVHIGNAFVVIGALLLGGVYGGLAGAVGLALADILSGYAESSPRTFITKLVIGLIVGLIAHKIAKINEAHPKAYVVKWSLISTIAGLGFNCFFEPALKYVWYTLLYPNPEKIAKMVGAAEGTQEKATMIQALVAVTTYATAINAVINTILAVILYNLLRPALIKAGIIKIQKKDENK